MIYAIKELQVRSLAFLTSTLIINCIQDLAGLLILAQEIKLGFQDRDKEYFSELKDYVKGKAEQDALVAKGDAPLEYIPTFPLNPFNKNCKRFKGIIYYLASNYNLYLFNPFIFNKRINSIIRGELLVSNIYNILRPILRYFQLRRVIASEVQLLGDQRIHISALIPTFTIIIIKLEMTALQAYRYYQVYKEYATNLTYSIGDQEDEFSCSKSSYSYINALKYHYL